ncbi:MAG TPA: hypothetical protein ENJ34_03165 [Epsilonproteobacteria bacterium]|nr:hypothetical protein [Campylobacterota bacterium]
MVGGTTIHMATSFQKREAPIRNKSEKFTQQDVDLSQTPLFFPEGYEQIFLGIYFISLPYIAGLLFQYFYIADGKTELFLSLNEQSSFLLTWLIGYEIVAGLVILYIIKMALSFAKESAKGHKTAFRRP